VGVSEEDERFEDLAGEIRLQIGVGAQEGMEAMDAEISELLVEIVPLIDKLKRLLTERGVSRRNQLNFVVGMAIAAIVDEDDLD
jgi:hypothetical protein